MQEENPFSGSSFKVLHLLEASLKMIITIILLNYIVTMLYKFIKVFLITISLNYPSCSEMLAEQVLPASLMVVAKLRMETIITEAHGVCSPLLNPFRRCSLHHFVPRPLVGC